MAIEVNHMGHAYIFRHPSGWSGGVKRVRDKLNEELPAGEYPVDEAEEIALRHALHGALSGGEAVVPESGRHFPDGGPGDDFADEADAAPREPDRILLAEDDDSGESGSRPDWNPEGESFL